MRLFKRLRGGKDLRERDQRAYRQGHEFGERLVSKVDAFSTTRLDQITVDLLEIFRERLDTVYDDPEHEPRLVAAAELEIFKEQITKAQENMWSELQDHLSEEVEIADTVGMVEVLGELIEHAAEQRINVLIAGAKTLYEIKLEEIGKR